MKRRTLPLAAVMSMVLIHTIGAVPQPKSIHPTRMPEGRVPHSDRIESIIPREGLQFYLEITSAGLAEIVRSGNAATVSQILAAGPFKVTAVDLAAFVSANSSTFSNAKVAIAGYGTGGVIAIVETATPQAAEQLGAGVARLFGPNRRSQKTASSDLDVSIQGHLLVAGERAMLARLAEANGRRTLADDQEFMKARARFSEDQIFAFVELSAGGLWSPSAAGGAMEAAQTAGMLAAMGGMPYAIALGGSLEGDAATFRAVLLNASKPSGGGVLSNLLGSLFSSSKSGTLGEPMAASFAAPNADVFVDLMIDWDKLLDAIQSMFGMFAGAVASGASDGKSNSPAQSGDFLAMAEASLGFSFKNDLIPTLGNELAITLSGINASRTTTLAGPIAISPGQMPNAGVKKGSPQFMLLVAVRDEAKFERLLGKLLNGPIGASARAVTRTPYRGATISSSKDFAYTITGGFLLAGGSVAEIRRAIDAHALGTSLASTSEFRQAMGGSRNAMLQAYLSSRLSKNLFDSLSKEAARADGRPQEATVTSPTASAIGVSINSEDDALMINARVPTNLALLALGSMLSAKPAPYGISSSPAGTDSGSRRNGGSTTPRLTDDDLRRRP